MNRNFAGNVGVGGKPTLGGNSIPDEVAPEYADELLSDKEFASLLGCGRSTIWRYASEGILPKPVKIGGLSRWFRSDGMAIIANAKAEREAA